MCIACNDTSVIVINFRKSKTHAITDTYCIGGVVYRKKSFFFLRYTTPPSVTFRNFIQSLVFTRFTVFMVLYLVL